MHTRILNVMHKLKHKYKYFRHICSILSMYLKIFFKYFEFCKRDRNGS